MPLYRVTKHVLFPEIDFKGKEGEVREFLEGRAKQINDMSPGVLELFDPAKHMPVIYDPIARRMYDPYKREHFGDEDIDDPKETAKKAKKPVKEEK